MRKAMIAALAAAALLSGCSGAQYLLPQISDAEISKAAYSVHSDASALPRLNRPVMENTGLVFSITGRLWPASQALCQHARVTNCNFQVHYEDDPDFNAYASEGNNIHINRGLLDRLASEEEIAAVIAHEMGHHIAQHIEETQENALIGALIGAALAGAVLATGDNDPGTTQRVIGSSMAAGGMIGALSFSKEQEREADLISAYMLARAGYDLRKAGRLFTVLSRIDPDKERASLFDTHPAGPERVAAWEKAIAEVEASPDKFPREQ